MKIQRFLYVAAALAVSAAPLSVFAQWQGAPGTPPNNNASGPVWLNPSSQQSGSFSISGNGTIGQVLNVGQNAIIGNDLYFTSTGKSIRVDGNGARTLSIGNYDTGSNDTFTLNIVRGDPYLEAIRFIVTDSTGVGQICLNGDCRSSWPTTSGGSQYLLKSGDSMTGPLGIGIASSTNYWINVEHPEAGTGIRSNAAGYGVYAFGGAYGLYGYGNWGAAYLDGIVYAEQYCLISGGCLSAGGGGGGITQINGGTGITVSNGTGPTATISANTNQVQARVTGDCPAGQSIRKINVNGTVDCEVDDVGGGGGGGNYLPITGGTMQGTITFQASPANSITGIRNLLGPSIFMQSAARLDLKGQSGVFIDGFGNGLNLTDALATKANGGLWSASSDIRLKDVKGAYTYGLDELLQINPIWFSYKKDHPAHYDTSVTYAGVSAQEVKKVIPEAISVDENGYYLLDATPIQWAAINAIKELKAENDSLKAEVDDLKTRLDRLEAAIR